ncbi:PadR family transcriptional regulator [Actinoallomurus bryophytorum]|uniref:PadR family transcriptional regulator n=1 Tax=Actinoallomurus bryophytorum TaxID=1490222 RepID=A0A543C0H1_9ACTN|nr:helix-turn-helix transcriptional regulator [Actinoallomurus bryophytorum]TQL90573.1 PadR family transcriptional regulator [Actinoallomurus bryophytorum]
MQEPTFLILTALADRAQHGYGIMRDAELISDGRVRLRAGTLYAALLAGAWPTRSATGRRTVVAGMNRVSGTGSDVRRAGGWCRARGAVRRSGS